MEPTNTITIDDLLKLEKEHRKAQKWLMFSGIVKKDNGETVKVQLKSFGDYNQIFRIGDDGINYCSGHSISKVKPMQEFIRNQINK